MATRRRTKRAAKRKTTARASKTSRASSPAARAARQTPRARTRKVTVAPPKVPTATTSAPRDEFLDLVRAHMRSRRAQVEQAVLLSFERVAPHAARRGVRGLPTGPEALEGRLKAALDELPLGQRRTIASVARGKSRRQAQVSLPGLRGRVTVDLTAPSGALAQLSSALPPPAPEPPPPRPAPPPAKSKAPGLPRARSQRLPRRYRHIDEYLEDARVDAPLPEVLLVAAPMTFEAIVLGRTIEQAYAALPNASARLGRKLGQAYHSARDPDWLVQRYARGVIVKHGPREPVALYGAIYDRWRFHRGEAGSLGFPKGHIVHRGARAYARFEGGLLTYAPGHGDSIFVDERLAQAWLRSGDFSGPYGVPVTVCVPVSAGPRGRRIHGYMHVFSNGELWVSEPYGVCFVPHDCAHAHDPDVHGFPVRAHPGAPQPYVLCERGVVSDVDDASFAPELHGGDFWTWLTLFAAVPEVGAPSRRPRRRGAWTEISLESGVLFTATRPRRTRWLSGAIAHGYRARGGFDALGLPVAQVPTDDGGQMALCAKAVLFARPGATSAVAIPTGPIQRAYAQSGGPAGPLGHPKRYYERYDLADGVTYGALCRFDHGEIFFNQALDAAVVLTGPMWQRWTQSGGVRGLGPPLQAVQALAGGYRALRCADGGLLEAPAVPDLDLPARAYALAAPVVAAWIAAASSDTPLGPPTAGYLSHRHHSTLTCTQGTVYYHPTRVPGDLITLYGPTRDRFERRGGTSGPIGWPAGPEVPITHANAVELPGEHGALVTELFDDVFVPSAAHAKWRRQGRANSRLGLPTAEPEGDVDSGRYRQKFQGGWIHVDGGKASVEIADDDLSLYFTRVHCGVETDEAGDDEMAVQGTAVEARGAVEAIPLFDLGDFESGETRYYEGKGRLLHRYPIVDGPRWPKTYLATLALTEMDVKSYGAFARELSETTRWAVEQAVGYAVDAALTKVGLGEVPWIEDELADLMSGYVVETIERVLAAVAEWLGHDVFAPRVVVQVMYRFDQSGLASGKLQWRQPDGGIPALYDATYIWRRGG